MSKRLAVVRQGAVAIVLLAFLEVELRELLEGRVFHHLGDVRHLGQHLLVVVDRLLDVVEFVVHVGQQVVDLAPFVAVVTAAALLHPAEHSERLVPEHLGLGGGHRVTRIRTLNNRWRLALLVELALRRVDEFLGLGQLPECRFGDVRDATLLFATRRLGPGMAVDAEDAGYGARRDPERQCHGEPDAGRSCDSRAVHCDPST